MSQLWWRFLCLLGFHTWYAWGKARFRNCTNLFYVSERCVYCNKSKMTIKYLDRSE